MQRGERRFMLVQHWNSQMCVWVTVCVLVACTSNHGVSVFLHLQNMFPAIVSYSCSLMRTHIAQAKFLHNSSSGGKQVCDPPYIIIFSLFSAFICTKHASHYVNKGDSLGDWGHSLPARFSRGLLCSSAQNGGHRGFAGVNHCRVWADLTESVPQAVIWLWYPGIRLSGDRQ